MPILVLIRFYLGYFNRYDRLCYSKQIWLNYETFIPLILTILKLISYTVKEMKWIISLHKLSFYCRDFFVKVSWNPFCTMKIAIDCILFITFQIFIVLWWRQFCTFLVNFEFEFIKTNDVSKFND